MSDSEAPPAAISTGVKSRLKRTSLLVSRPHNPTTFTEDAAARRLRYSQGLQTIVSPGITSSELRGWQGSCSSPDPTAEQQQMHLARIQP